MADVHNWTHDAAVGIYKNHQLSKKLLEVAVGECKILPFTHDHGLGFKKNAGETVNIMHVNRLPDAASARLLEEGQIPIRKLSFGNRALTLHEYGEGVQYTELMEQLSEFKPSNILQKELRLQMERALDTEAARYGFLDPLAVKLCFIPTSLTGGVWDVDGTPNTLATSGLTYDHCTVISDYMRDTIHVPFYEGDNYVGLSCNKNLRSLKNDRYFQQWHQYAQLVSFVYKGEFGMTDRIRWVEINRAAALSNVAGNSTVLGEAVVFGDEGVARIEAVAPHLRLNPNFQGRFGTIQAAAWWGVLAFGSVWEVADDGKAKIIRIASS